jgi:hypothetical protein
MLFKILMTGDVPPIPAAQVEEMKKAWLKLPVGEARQRAYDNLEASTQYRRKSLSENAQKGSFVLSALGFAFAIVVFALPSAKGSDLVFTKASVVLFMSAAAIVWMSSPKLKIFTRKRNREPEGLRKLRVLVAETEEEREFERYVRLTNLRERRDMNALMERRALATATIFFILGLVINAMVLLS